MAVIPRYLALHANLLTNANRFDEAMAGYEGFFGNHKGFAQDWMQYAFALKTVGRQEDAVAAYREAIARAPGNGAAWHALSNMKLAVYTNGNIAVMEEQLRREDVAEEDRYNIYFTLGKAYEDREAYGPWFENYTQANSIRRAQIEYDIGRLEDYVAQAKEVFTPEFFKTRKGFGTPEADPIFIVGLHRAGSTLTEQILSSHSQIEGTRDLPDLLRIGRDCGDLATGGQETGLNKGLLADLDADECAALGRTFLEGTRDERRTDRPYFIDKIPANWMYAGLIHLILPKAKIIDIRHQPIAAGFALFKMNFGRGVDHSYDQKDIARYYRAYADLMAHFDVVLPGRIHHLQYEALVDETEAEIRRMIDYCGLPFEEQCLRYWETERAVQTPSSEQVRKPIFKDAVEQWRNYTEWLGPMEEVFADMLTSEPTATARERS
ncbi:MAG: sulfotransferase [Alphaproteobacteria bacterium]|nr:sulfotransferase [Alphaproteobacteria bacterium]